MSRKVSSASIASLLGIVCGGASVLAAEESATATAPTLEEVIVTAQKRSENAQSVPVTINVVTAAALEQQGITNGPELTKIVPGLTFQTLNGSGSPYIRGMGSQQTTQTQESSVGFYIDGVYQTATTASTAEFSDVDHIEVLKGPQGTLFGRNSTAGAINIITRTPQSGFSGSVDASAGSWGTVHFKSYTTGGSETLNGSLAVSYAYHDGYLHNLYNGHELDNLNTAAMRGKIQAHFSDDWSAVLALNYTENHDNSSLAYTYLNDNAQPLDVGGRITTDPRATYNDADHYERRMLQDEGASLTVRGKVAGLDLVSISAWSHLILNTSEDNDASDANEAVLLARGQRLNSYSQDLQLVSPAGSALKWVAGLYYFNSNGGFPKTNNLILLGPTDASTVELAGQEKTESEAVYGNISYDFSSMFSASLGGRFNRDKKTLLAGRVTLIPAAGIALGPEPEQSATWNNFSPKAVLEMHLAQDSMLYASVSKGYKAGSWQIVSSSTSVVSPENVLAYEIGGKHTFDDNRLRFNWATFYNRYKDLQVDVITDLNLIATANAASAHTYGIDWDLNYAVSNNLRVNAGMEWLHATYTDYKNAAVYIPNSQAGVAGLGNTEVLQDATGNRLVDAPNATFNIGATYSVPIGNGSLDFNASESYNNGFYLDPNNRVRVPAYSMVSTRVTYTNNNWSVYFFGNNLLNKAVLSGIQENSFGDLVQYSDPRILGGGVTFKF